MKSITVSFFIITVSILARHSSFCITGQFKRTTLFLSDFLRKLEYSKLVAYVSWSEVESTSFSKMLSKISILHTIIMKNNVPVLQYLEKSNRIVVLLDMKFKDSVRILQDPANHFLFREPYIWILLGNPENIRSHEVFFPIHSMVYIADNTNTSHFNVKAIFKLNRTSSVYRSNNIAEWSSENGFNYLRKLTPVSNRTNFLGMPIRASYVIADNDSLNHLSDYRNVDTDKLSKMNYRLMDSIVDLLNASKVNIWAQTWGYMNLTTGTYDEGMFRDLLTDNADITGTTSFIQEDRLESFMFLVPSTHEEVKFVFRAPPLSYTSNIYTLSFSPFFYLSCIVTLFLGAILIYFLVLVEYRCGAIPFRMTFTDVVILQICSITQNGDIKMPILPAPRIAVFFNLIFCMLIYTAFSAYIVIVLQSTSDQINDLRSLYDSKMPIGVQNTPYNEHYFTTANSRTNEYYRKLYYENRLQEKKTKFLSPNIGMKKVQEGFYAFNVELSTAYHFIRNTFKDNEKCNIKTTSTIFDSDEPYLAIPKNSAYYNFLQVGFRRLFETGLHQREYVKFFTKKINCHGAQRNYDSVRLNDCYFPFLIVAYGCIFSIFMLLLENLLDKIRKKKDMVLRFDQHVGRYTIKRIAQKFDFVN